MPSASENGRAQGILRTLSDSIIPADYNYLVWDCCPPCHLCLKNGLFIHLAPGTDFMRRQGFLKALVSAPPILKHIQTFCLLLLQWHQPIFVKLHLKHAPTLASAFGGLKWCFFGLLGNRWPFLVYMSQILSCAKAMIDLFNFEMRI